MNWSSAPDVVDEDIDIEGDSITDDALRRPSSPIFDC